MRSFSLPASTDSRPPLLHPDLRRLRQAQLPGHCHAFIHTRAGEHHALQAPVPSRRVAIAWRKGFARPQAVKVLAEAIRAIDMPCVRGVK